MSELSVGQLKGLLSNSNTVTVPSGHKLHVPGTVVQFVDYKYPSLNDNYTTISADTEFVTPISVSITPKFSNSKLVIHSEAQSRFVNAYGMSGGLKRDGVVVPGGYNRSDFNFIYKGDQVNHHFQVVCNTSVSAVSTSSTTFTMWLKPYAGTGEWNEGWGNNYIQVWEIAQ